MPRGITYFGGKLLIASEDNDGLEQAMTTTTTSEIQALASLMAVDEDNELWLGGDGLKDAQNRADVNRLIELGVVRSAISCGCLRIYVNDGYEKFFERF